MYLIDEEYLQKVLIITLVLCVAPRHVNAIVFFTSFYDKLKLQEEINDVRGFPGDPSDKNPPTNAGNIRDAGSIPGWGKIACKTKWQPTSVSLPGGSHGQRSLAGCSPWGRKESGMTEVT